MKRASRKGPVSSTGPLDARGEPPRSSGDGALLEELVRRLLEHQDPTQEHTWLTRVTVSLVIVIAHVVLYGFYGVVGSVAFYLLGVELAGLGLAWMYLPLGVMVAYGLWKSARALVDYWLRHGHG